MTCISIIGLYIVLYEVFCTVLPNYLYCLPLLGSSLKEKLVYHIIFCFSIYICISSVQFNHSAVSDSLQPHESQHARSPCPSPIAGVYPNPCPLSRWCHPTISSSVVSFSSCPQSFPASGSFPRNPLFKSGGQVLRASASMNIQWIFRVDFL